MILPQGALKAALSPASLAPGDPGQDQHLHPEGTTFYDGRRRNLQRPSACLFTIEKVAGPTGPHPSFGFLFQNHHLPGSRELVRCKRVSQYTVRQAVARYHHLVVQ